ncbi:MAG: DUF1836 domain-containing protein [Eubacteriales bacterium]|nr:DUF1836 domain-containing protein [Eubacteriales bacterium]
MRLIHWQEMPAFEIYSDQLITIVNRELSFMNIEVTNSMVNNYVKHKVMPLPIKKKYNQIHIAYLIMISLLKSAFSMEEIKHFFQTCPVEQGYDRFCDIFQELWQKNDTDLSIETNKLAVKSEPLCQQVSHLLAITIISKFRATNLLLQKGENNAPTTS